MWSQVGKLSEEPSDFLMCGSRLCRAGIHPDFLRRSLDS